MAPADDPGLPSNGPSRETILRLARASRGMWKDRDPDEFLAASRSGGEKAPEQVAESVGGQLDNPRFPHISYRFGVAGPAAVIRGTGIRVQTLVVAVQSWAWSTVRVAEDYGLSPAQVEEALAFYDVHREEIDALLAEEEQLAAEAAG